MEKIKFDVLGMTCSSCVEHVEKAVSNLKGAKKVNVNLLSNSMIVEFDEKNLNVQKIIDAVKNSGYSAKISNVKKDKKKNDTSDLTKQIKRNMKKRLITSICFLIPLMVVAMMNKDKVQDSMIIAITQFLLLLPIIYENRNYYIVGYKMIFKGTPNMDSLIALGSSAAIIYGIFAIYMISFGLGHNNLDIVERYSKDIYFESAGMILTLITLGKYLETKSKQKTNDAISKLVNLAPKKAIVIRDNKEMEIDVENIVINDKLVIKPGASIPVDGVVIEGGTSVDQSSITGESIPVNKEKGDILISGTINQNGYVKMRATKVGDDTTLSQIINLVEEAGNSKAPISKLADKVSGIFVPVVILIAIIATLIWIMTGQSFEFALTIGISVLVISCPCALGLATPVAIMVATGKGAENGILIKSAESLELLHSIDTVVLDKTGTITEAKPKVTDIISNINEKQLLQIVGSLEKRSEHALGNAIIEKVKEKNIELQNVSEFKVIEGRGVRGKINNIKYLVGNTAFIKENEIKSDTFKDKLESFAKEGKTCIYCAREKQLIGAIALSAPIKETSEQAIATLKEMNIEVIMLTGDNTLVAKTIGEKVGIKKAVAELLPQDKESEIEKLQKDGKKVVFVGDGINDSPALVKSNVGIAISSGTDIAIESADIVLMKNDLLDIVNAINLSKETIKNIKINLFWAFFYNSIGIPLAAGVFYNWIGLRLNPMIGALAMSLSSVCVVTNALRLKKFKPILKVKKEENKIMKEIIINIEGMKCEHCKTNVEKALNAIDGVGKVTVSLENNNAIIESEKEINNEKIKEVIEEAGYKVI